MSDEENDENRGSSAVNVRLGAERAGARLARRRTRKPRPARGEPGGAGAELLEALVANMHIADEPAAAPAGARGGGAGGAECPGDGDGDGRPGAPAFDAPEPGEVPHPGGDLCAARPARARARAGDEGGDLVAACFDDLRQMIIDADGGMGQIEAICEANTDNRRSRFKPR